MPYTGYISTKKNQGNPRLLEVQDHCAKTRTMSQRQPCASEPCLAELLQYLPGWSRNRLPRFPQFHSHMDRKFIRFCLIFECLPHDSYGKKKQTNNPALLQALQSNKKDTKVWSRSPFYSNTAQHTAGTQVFIEQRLTQGEEYST